MNAKQRIQDILEVSAGRSFQHVADDIIKCLQEAHCFSEDVLSLKRQLEESRRDAKMNREARATHRCKVCSALWVMHPNGGGWSLCSDSCGKCCDNVAMGSQIEPVGIFAESKEAFRTAQDVALRRGTLLKYIQRLSADPQPSCEAYTLGRIREVVCMELNTATKAPLDNDVTITVGIDPASVAKLHKMAQEFSDTMAQGLTVK